MHNPTAAADVACEHNRAAVILCKVKSAVVHHVTGNQGAGVHLQPSAGGDGGSASVLAAVDENQVVGADLVQRKLPHGAILDMAVVERTALDDQVRDARRGALVADHRG